MRRILLSIIAVMVFLVNAKAQEYLYIGNNVIPVSSVKKITSSVQVHPGSLFLILENDKNISLYVEALKVTGMMDSLMCYIDNSYGFASKQDIKDSCTWTNNQLCIPTAVEYDNVAFPKKRFYNFTAFIVPDSILEQKYGITDLDGLRAKARELYAPVYPEDMGITDETDRRNYLNRFISYHILDRLGTYYTLTSNDGGKLCNNFNRHRWDIADWYETLMPHSIMKFSFPYGSNEGLYINRRGVQDRADELGVFVHGSKITPPSSGPALSNAVNGMYHYIDDIAAYDQNTQSVVLSERMRFDCSTLSPDFMTRLTDGETARGHSAVVAANNGKYGQGGQGNVAANNVNHCVGFKAGFVRNFEFNTNTHIHVRNRVLGFWSYQGDDVTIKGPYDVTVKLPPVPEGKYELRMGYCADFVSRGIVAFFIDGKPCDIVDLRPNGQTLFGWRSDDALGFAESIAEHDRSIHNKGWMKGPACYSPGEKDTYGGSPMRDLSNTVRRVVGTFYTDGKSDHYLRLKQMMEAGGELNFDFIELVPVSVYDNEIYVESKW